MSQITDLNARLLLAERERDELQRVNFKLRDKLLEICAECSDCNGVGVQTILGETGPCPACEDIRELLA